MSNSINTPFQASTYTNDQTHHLLLAASGSVATIKLPLILQSLSHHPNLTIRVLLTKSSLHFLQLPDIPSASSSYSKQTDIPNIEADNGDENIDNETYLSSLLKIPNVAGIHLDEEEWSHPWTRSSPILHIELRRWADLLVVAPLSANTLAKIVGGMADNLLCSVVRAWDTTGNIDSVIEGGIDGVTSSSVVRTVKKKRIIVAPAMNTAMWRHPVTAKQIRVLEGEWGVGKEGEGDGWFEVLRPVEKELACGDVGDGAMREWKEIVGVIEERLGLGVGG